MKFLKHYKIFEATLPDTFNSLFLKYEKEAVDRYLTDIAKQFKEYGYTFEVTSMKDPEHIFVKVNSIPMLLKRYTEINRNYGYQMLFRNFPIIRKHCSEFALHPELKNLFHTNHLPNVAAVVKAFEDKDINSYINPKIRNVNDKTGMLENLNTEFTETFADEFLLDKPDIAKQIIDNDPELKQIINEFEKNDITVTLVKMKSYHYPYRWYLIALNGIEDGIWMDLRMRTNTEQQYNFNMSDGIALDFEPCRRNDNGNVKFFNSTKEIIKYLQQELPQFVYPKIKKISKFGIV